MKRPDIERMEMARRLLPPPGDEVVGDLLEYVKELERQVEELERGLRDQLTAQKGRE